MRASRLLQILLILQNRGRQTSVRLAEELEVSPRTILRDVDAMTEAGLPVIVHQGNRGGIELGFNYRTRLTGLAADEAEALGVILGRNPAEAEALGLGPAARRAAAKLVESLPDGVRARVETARARHPVAGNCPQDPRVAAIAQAIRQRRTVTLAIRGPGPRTILPASLGFDGTDWWLAPEGRPDERIPCREWHDINISRRAPPQDLA